MHNMFRSNQVRRPFAAEAVAGRRRAEAEVGGS